MPTRPVLVLAALLCAGALSRAADVSPEPPPDVALRPQAGAAKCTLRGGPRGLAVDVVGGGAVFESGATLAFRSAPPRRLTFRFAQMRGLSSFTFTDGTRTCQATLGLGGRSQAHFDAAGRPAASAALAAVTITSEVTRAGDLLVVVSTRAPMGKAVECRWSQFQGRNIFGFKDS
jgi:hypothetical protein